MTIYYSNIQEFANIKEDGQVQLFNSDNVDDWGYTTDHPNGEGWFVSYIDR